MGAESSILQGCKLEDPLDTPGQSDWRLHPAKRRDGSRVSVFVHKKSEQEDRRLENAAKQLKILRHPTILKFFASCDNVEGTYLITEQVRPLELVLDTLTPEEICAGLYNIAEALSFLHDRGGASHNNVCVSSIYVSVQDGGWRLGGMEHLCKFEDATVQFLKNNRALRNAEAIPPEEQLEGSMSSTAPSHGHARDAYAFGILAQNLLEYLTDLGSMSMRFEQRISDEFLHTEPTMRPKLATILNDQLFKNDFLEITNFLVHLTIKSEGAKNAFFEGLAPRLNRLPRELVANRLAPLLLSSFVMAEPMAVSAVLPHFMTPLRESPSKNRDFLIDQVNPLFPVDLYKQYVIPTLIRIFPSREMHVRICLLQYFASYVDLFDVTVLRKGILPQLLVGLKDSHDELVSASLKGLSHTVPILGGQVVVGGERIKYFVEGRPKFFSKKESPLKDLDNVTNLTAVSGVITLPPLEKAPPAKDPPAPPDREGRGSEDEEAVARRQEERERRREEMRLKNEQRRKEREAKKAQASARVTLLSMANTGEESAKESVEATPNSEVTLPRGEEQPVSGDQKERPADSQASPTRPQANSDVFAPEKEEDWSDWDNVDNKPGFASTHDPSPDQSGISELSSADTAERASPEPTTPEWAPLSGDSALAQSGWSRVESDWSQADSDWTASNPKEPASSTKKSAKPLQLKKLSGAKTPDPPKPEARNPAARNPAASRPSAPRSSSKRPTKTAKKSADLGSEFSIPDMVSSPKGASEEPDFFADMAPSFSFAGAPRASETKRGTGGRSGLLPGDKSTAVSSSVGASQRGSMSFEVTSVSAEPGDDGDGWGMEDDFNWEDVGS